MYPHIWQKRDTVEDQGCWSFEDLLFTTHFLKNASSEKMYKILWKVQLQWKVLNCASALPSYIYICMVKYISQVIWIYNVFAFFSYYNITIKTMFYFVYT